MTIQLPHIEIPVVCESSKHVLSIQMTNQLIISVRQHIMHTYEVQWQDFKREELVKGITDGFNARSRYESEISMGKNHTTLSKNKIILNSCQARKIHHQTPYKRK